MAKKYDHNSEKNTISIVKTYDSFDDVKKAGEKIYYKNKDFSGYLVFQSAYVNYAPN
ncbi:hypothetical protein [Anaerosporobacter sp.]|uniref:hypothetical protein n=1 Tax=Anaerosporobacter sp. TaxID=1872529 RepID=UPI00286F6889|nr:hypothetical protein [Anaerosporobacter sp.]